MRISKKTVDAPILMCDKRITENGKEQTDD